ncbi:uncharacterized protein LOC142888019 [Nelusetta ayraudi]|uniref:uncharacterized protein LOC142888019 n=1 Tax=Nelusetta ayraudi TaxID=303726 RepID=UPI003F6FC925
MFAGVQSVTGLGSDLDAASLDDSEPPTAPGAATQQRVHANSNPAFKAKSDIRETCRHRCPVEDRDADTEEEEETSRPSGRRRSERTSSDWLRMKNHFLALQCRCVEEEEQLQLKTTQIRATELSLSGLQQRWQHALREKHIAAERARIGREDVTLALIVKGGRTKKDSESAQQHNLRKQELCVLEPSVVMSALERDELDRLLSDTKTELFAQKRRAREELEALQERLEETCEELQRAAEAESFLRSRCSSLEEEQRQDKEQMKLQEQEIRKLQVSLEQEQQEAKSREEELQVALEDKRESQEVVRQLQQGLQLAMREADGLRVSLEEQQLSARETEQQLLLWAQQLGAECQLLRHLVEPGGAKQGSEPSPPSLTVPETLSHLGALRERLTVATSRLHRELLSQRQTAELLRHSKEQELNLQRQQLRTERDRDLKTLKERLIQEHIEELSTLTWAPLCDEGRGGGGGGEGEGRGGGTAASLRKQLQAKDQELRQVHRRMEQWKEQTAARLACKFEEELTAELERCKIKLLRARKSAKTQDRLKCVRPEVEEPPSPKQDPQIPAGSPSLRDGAPCSPSDVASLKLVRYLQERVKQLRVENDTCSWSLSPPRPAVPCDLSGSCPSTDTAGTQSRSSPDRLRLRTRDFTQSHH